MKEFFHLSDTSLEEPAILQTSFANLDNMLRRATIKKLNEDLSKALPEVNPLQKLQRKLHKDTQTLGSGLAN